MVTSSVTGSLVSSPRISFQKALLGLESSREAWTRCQGDFDSGGSYWKDNKPPVDWGDNSALVTIPSVNTEVPQYHCCCERTQVENSFGVATTRYLK